MVGPEQRTREFFDAIRSGKPDQAAAMISRQSLQARDLARRGDGTSHYRVQQETWRDVFRPEHHQVLDEVAPGLVTRLGYAD